MVIDRSPVYFVGDEMVLVTQAGSLCFIHVFFLVSVLSGA